MKTDEIIKDSEESEFTKLLKQQIEKKQKKIDNENEKSKKSEKIAQNLENNLSIPKEPKKKILEQEKQNENKIDYSKSLRNRLGLGSGSVLSKKNSENLNNKKPENFLTAWKKRKIEKRIKDVADLKKQKKQKNMKSKEEKNLSRAEKIKRAKERRNQRIKTQKNI